MSCIKVLKEKGGKLTPKRRLILEFIYHHAEDGHHHHLVCSECGKTTDCDEDLFTPVEKSLWEKHGFQIDFKHFVMSGRYKECSSKKN